MDDIPPAAVDNIKKRRLVVEDSTARVHCPSELAQPQCFRKLDQSKFALHRPLKPTELPLALLHPIFVEFVANVKHHKPNPKDHALVLELRKIMSEPWENEMEQSDQFRMILENHYGIHLSSGTVAATRHMSYGHGAVGGHMYVVFEMKCWNGNGDPEVQASLYTLEALRPPIRKERTRSIYSPAS